MPHCDAWLKQAPNQGVEAPANIFRGFAGWVRATRLGYRLSDFSKIVMSSKAI